MLASIAGPDILIVVAVLVLLFGASQLPKLARSLGSASHEFKRAHEEGERQASSAPSSSGPMPSDGPAPTTNRSPVSNGSTDPVRAPH